MSYISFTIYSPYAASMGVRCTTSSGQWSYTLEGVTDTFINVNSGSSVTPTNVFTNRTCLWRIAGNVVSIAFLGGADNYHFVVTSILSWENGYITDFNAGVGIIDFSNFKKLTSVPSSLPTTMNVTKMSNAFLVTTPPSVINCDLSNWNTSNVTAMDGCFNGASNFNGALTNWNTAKVTDMNNMFLNCSAFNQSVNQFNTSNVTNMRNMFDGCTAFNQKMSNWNLSKITANNMLNFFNNNNTFSTSNWTATLIGWAANPPTINNVGSVMAITLPANYLPTASTARNYLTGTKGFIFLDSGLTTSYISLNYTVPSSATIGIPIGALSSGTATIDWDDGTTASSGVTAGITNHTYTTAGTYNVTIIGNVSQYGSSTALTPGLAGQQYLKAINNIDTGVLTSIAYIGCNAINLTTVVPVLPSTVQNLNYAMYYTTNINQSFEYWNVTNVTSMVNFFTKSGMAPLNYYYTVKTWQPAVSSTILGLAGVPQVITCFKVDSKIWCLIDGEDKYISIQDMRPGTLVKTVNDGYLKVSLIGRSMIINEGGTERNKDRLYKCSKENYPQLFEDLYITGAHSILVQMLSDEQYQSTIDALGTIYITSQHSRLMAYLDERSEPYEVNDAFEIWHFSLESDDTFVNYGVYANGLLVETVSIRWMLEYASMELIF